MFKSLNNSLYEIISNLFNEKDRNSIIEPLICLVRLAILDFKPIGTKISLNNNKIKLNKCVRILVWLISLFQIKHHFGVVLDIKINNNFLCAV